MRLLKSRIGFVSEFRRNFKQIVDIFVFFKNDLNSCTDHQSFSNAYISSFLSLAKSLAFFIFPNDFFALLSIRSSDHSALEIPRARFGFVSDDFFNFKIWHL